MGTDVQGSIFFLARDPKHDLEKPYALRFTTSDGFPTTNTQSEEHSGIPIKDLRPLQADLSFEKTGIKIMKTQSSMSYDDFDDESKIQETYLAETARDLKEALGAKRVHIIEHLVRKRHATFPIATGDSYQFQQPTSLAHIDSTVEATATFAEKFNSEESDDALEGSHYAYVNAWRPLRGPVQDWPLTLCDASTVQPDEDLVASDLVFADYAIENYQIYHSKRHQWYYLKEQMPDEFIVFRQCDSSRNKELGAGE
ncbi:hypothetical protein MMC21_005645 [Puttea exsequens]|nr:hypothetical protein [Puttea exsequens]